MRILCLLILTVVTGCERTPDTRDNSGFRLDLQQVLGRDGGEDSEAFLRAEGNRMFTFPRDHGGHPGYRNEWWYLTGNLRTDTGRRFGYQLTFFRAALRPPADTDDSHSAWHSEHIWMAHAALSDVQGNTHIALERFSRENPGLAGVQTEPFRVWLENWSLSAQGEGADFPWQIDLSDPAFSLQLRLSPAKPLVLQGDRGLSQKSPASGNASWYYSFTRLHTEGELILGDAHFQLTGASWLDREWSTSALSSDQTGWDWFSLQFADGRELMYYQLRNSSGQAHPSSRGNWTNRSAQQTVIRPEDIRLEELRQWQSPDGTDYTTQWRMHYQGREWIVAAVMEDQFMDLALPYWEGAVDVLDAASGETVGQGYLEMVRE